MKKQNPTATMTVGEEGLVLNPGTLYLCCTVEWIETDYHVVAVGSRSSVARLGIAVHQTAPFGHMGWKGRLTLEVSVVEPVRVYVDKPICQLFFMTTVGKPRLYNGTHQNQKTALPSMFWKEPDANT
jgi:dCTP deaminase